MPNFTALTTGSDSVTRSSYDTASIAPAANRLLTIQVSSTRSDGAEVSSITGLGLTWTRIGGGTVGSSPTRAESIWEAETGGSAPTPGPLTLNYASGPTSVKWAVVAVDDYDTAAPITQWKVATGLSVASITATFDTTPAAGSGILAATAINVQENIAPGTGLTELTEVTIGGPNGTLETAARTTGAASASSSWTTATNAIMVALEIAAPAGGGSAVTGSVSASVPRVTGSTAGTTTAPSFAGTIAATTALVTASIAGTTTVPTFTADLDADLPRATASIAGTTTAPTFTAELNGALHALTGSLSGEVTNPDGSAILNGTVPRVTGSVAGAVTTPTFTAALAATTPALTGSLAGAVTASTSSATLAATLPAIASAVTGAVVNPDPGDFRDVAAGQPLPLALRAGESYTTLTAGPPRPPILTAGRHQ